MKKPLPLNLSLARWPIVSIRNVEVTLPFPSGGMGHKNAHVCPTADPYECYRCIQRRDAQDVLLRADMMERRGGVVPLRKRPLAECLKYMGVGDD